MGAASKIDADGTKLLCGMVFAFSGKFKLSQPALKSLVEAHGGACAASVTQKVTHVVTTPAALASDKRATALATAIGRQLPLISEDFVVQTAEKGVLQPLADFALGDEAAAATATSKESSDELVGELVRHNEVFMIRQAKKRFLLQTLWAWRDRVEGLEDARALLSGLVRRMRLENAMGAFFCAADEKHAGVDSVTDAMVSMNLNKPAPLEQQAAASLQPPDDTRVRLLIDTNVYLHVPLETWEQVERLHKDKAKIMIPHVVFEEVDRKRSSPQTELASQARRVMHFFLQQAKAKAGFWELQVTHPSTLPPRRA